MDILIMGIEEHWTSLRLNSDHLECNLAPSLVEESNEFAGNPNKSVFKPSNKFGIDFKQSQSLFLEHLMEKLTARCTAIVDVTNLNVEALIHHIEDGKKIFEEVLELIDITSTSVCIQTVDTKAAEFIVLISYMHLAKRSLVVVYDKSQQLDEDIQFLKENSKYIESFLTTLIKLDSDLPTRLSHIQRSPTSEEQEVIKKVTALFECQLLKRQVKWEADKTWATKGIHEFQQRIWFYIKNQQPLLFTMPAFPFKSINTKAKVIGTLPDMGEKLALDRLDKFIQSVKEVYPPGGHFVIFSDGRGYCDLFQVCDDITTEYKKHLNMINNSEHVSFVDLDMMFPTLDNCERRTAMVNLFGLMQDVERDIEMDVDFRESYCGFKMFLQEDLVFPKDIPKRRIRHETAVIAKRVLLRSNGHRNLLRIFFPNHIRLSIHPSTCTTKFSINLVGDTDWGTPWHNCALLQPDGSWSLIRRNTALEKGFRLEKCESGLPYFVNHTSEVYKGHL